MSSLPIRARLTVWYTAVLVVIVMALSAFVVVRFRSDLLRSLDERLATRAQQTTLALEDPTDPAEKLDLEELTKAGPTGLGDDGSVTQVVSPEGELLVTSGGGTERPVLSSRFATRVTEPSRSTVSHGGRAYRVLAVRLSRTGSLLVVAEPMSAVAEPVGRLIALLALSIPAAIAASALGGYLLAKRALRPIDEMTVAAAAIGSDDLASRLDVPEVADEIGRLGRTLNGMLGRLQTSVAEQQRFVADASHELRTPLSIIRAEVDVALRSPATPAGSRPVLTSVLEEVDRMQRVVENLLILARADEGTLELLSARVDLGDVGRTVSDRFEASAAAKGSTIEVDANGSAVVWGDRSLLEHLVSNLVDNAIRYSPAARPVAIRIGRDGDAAWIEVRDRGPGISPADRERVFDRFYRADEHRSRQAGGVGLGLAICRSIAEAHRGAIDVNDDDRGGAVFTVRLPGAGEDGG